MEEWNVLSEVNKFHLLLENQTPIPPPLPKQKKEHHNIDRGNDLHVDENDNTSLTSTSEKEESKAPSKPELGMKWFKWYLYGMIPLGILNTIADTLSPSIPISPVSQDLYVIVGFLWIIILAVLFYGLHRKKMWGWQLNWGVLIMTVIGAPFTFYEDTEMQLVFFFMAVIFFLWPNWVYFLNRKHLFNHQ